MFEMYLVFLKEKYQWFPVTLKLGWHWFMYSANLNLLVLKRESCIYGMIATFSWILEISRDRDAFRREFS